MTRIVTIKGVPHIAVTVSEPLMRSKLISDVLADGAMLVVNPQDGVLRIHRPVTLTHSLIYGGKTKTLAPDSEVGMLQVEDHLSAGVRHCYFTIERNGVEIYRTTLLDNDTREFLRQIAYAYRAFKA